MFFHWKLFFRALRLSLFGQPFRLRRWAYVLFFTALFLLFLAFVAVGRVLDHLFFPGFKRQPVKAPVFIVAPPRSGTHRRRKKLTTGPWISSTPSTTRTLPPPSNASGAKSRPTQVVGKVQR